MEILFNDVAEILAEVAECELEKITPDSNLADDLGVSSLMGLEVLVMLERKYGLKLQEEILFKMTTPQKIVDLLKEEVEESIESK